MKLSAIIVLVSVGASAAFAPSSPTFSRQSVSLEAEMSRMNFLGVASAATFAAALNPGAAVAGTMAQENVSDPTEFWESGKPDAAAQAKRMARYTNSRNQLTSNFAPIKRLTLERKSPVTRIDLNSPNFDNYKRTFPGLYKTVDEARRK